MKMKFLLVLTLMMSMNLFAQKVINYKYDGAKLKSTTDYFELSMPDITKPAGSKSVGLGGILTAAVGSIATVALDIVNAAITKKQATYTATYSNSYVFYLDRISYDLLTQTRQLIMKRYAINSMADVPDSSRLMTEFDFKFDSVSKNVIQLSLAKIYLPYSKARFKNDEKLAISIDIKISAGTDTTSKTSSLGEANVKIPIVQPASAAYSIGADYPMINKAVFQGFAKPAEGQTVPMTITVTVTEANLNHLTPSMVASLLKNNGSDLVSLMKDVFSSGSSSKSDSK